MFRALGVNLLLVGLFLIAGCQDRSNDSGHRALPQLVSVSNGCIELGNRELAQLDNLQRYAIYPRYLMTGTVLIDSNGDGLRLFAGSHLHVTDPVCYREISISSLPGDDYSIQPINNLFEQASRRLELVVEPEIETQTERCHRELSRDRRKARIAEVNTFVRDEVSGDLIDVGLPIGCIGMVKSISYAMLIESGDFAAEIYYVAGRIFIF